MHPTAGLGKKTVSSANRSDVLSVWIAFEKQFQSGADGVTIASATDELNFEKPVLAIDVVTHEADSRCSAVAEPQVEVAVVVPVYDRDGPAVVEEIQAGHG